MPQTELTRSQHTVVQLDRTSNDGSFRLGDTVTGTISYVEKQEYVGATVHSIALKLWARAKTKMVRSNGQSTTVYRGRATLFEVSVPLTEIYEHQMGASRSWRFSVVLPTTSSPGAAAADKWEARPPFLSNIGQGTQQHPLPPSYTYDNSSFGRSNKQEAFVEYVVECNIGLLKPGKGAVKPYVITVPIYVRVHGTQGPVVDLQLRTSTSTLLVKTLQLLPEKNDASLTFREKMRSTFQPSKVPEYSCQLAIVYPTVIQLDNAIFPFRLSHKPLLDDMHTNVPPEWYPSLKVTSLSLKISTITHVRTSGLLRDHTDQRSDKQTIYSSKYRPNGLAEVGVTLPPDPDVEIDLGAHLGLTVHRTGPTVKPSRPEPLPHGLNPKSAEASSSSQEPPSYAASSANPTARFETRLFPAFSTYNIAQTHTLDWKVKLVATGTDEELSTQGSTPIVLLEQAETAVPNGDGYGDGYGDPDGLQPLPPAFSNQGEEQGMSAQDFKQEFKQDFQGWDGKE